RCGWSSCVLGVRRDVRSSLMCIRLVSQGTVALIAAKITAMRYGGSHNPNNTSRMSSPRHPRDQMQYQTKEIGSQRHTKKPKSKHGTVRSLRASASAQHANIHAQP